MSCERQVRKENKEHGGGRNSPLHPFLPSRGRHRRYRTSVCILVLTSHSRTYPKDLMLFSGTIYIYNMLGEVKIHRIQNFLAIEKELDEKHKATNTSMCQGRNAHTTILP